MTFIILKLILIQTNEDQQEKRGVDIKMKKKNQIQLKHFSKLSIRTNKKISSPHMQQIIRLRNNQRLTFNLSQNSFDPFFH